MDGFSSHTLKLVNAKGEEFFVKFHFKTDQGIKNFTAEKATELSGKDPDYGTRDLFNAIQKKQFPSWTVHIQVPYFLIFGVADDSCAGKDLPMEHFGRDQGLAAQGLSLDPYR